MKQTLIIGDSSILFKDKPSEVFLILRTQLQFGLVSTGQYNTYTVEQTEAGLKVVEQASSEFNRISFLSINL